MYKVPEGLKYSRSHEWVRLEDSSIAVVGITDHAQAELGDIVYLNLPEPGRMLQYDEQFGEVESVKAVSELYTPLTGEVIESNNPILDNTEIVNEDPYIKGWLIKLRIADPKELENLMDANGYIRMLE